MYIAVFRVKQLDCFRASNYQIGDRAYYRLKPEDLFLDLNGNMRYRCNKKAVLYTIRSLAGHIHGSPDKKDVKKNFLAVHSACNGTVANGTANEVCQVKFSLNVFFCHFVFGRLS